MSTTITVTKDTFVTASSTTGAATSFLHPEYSETVDRWNKMRDVLAGETVVKDEGETYLPMTDGQTKQPNGAANYAAYKTRAIFWDYTREIATAMEGLLGRKPPVVKLPSALSSMEKRCAPTGETLAEFIAQVQAGQVEYGRIGILADVPDVENPAGFYLYPYSAQKILNWQISLIADEDRLVMVLLDESDYQLKGLQWEWTVQFRVCALDKDGTYYTTVVGQDQLTNFDLADPPETVTRPMFRGKVMDRVPFVMANVTRATPDIERPPLENVADLALALYRGEADYRQALFLQGQATPAFFGFSEDQIKKCMLGAGGGIWSTDPNARAQFLELAGAGLNEMRTSLENLHAAIVARGVSLLEPNEAESGEALQTRVDNKTASLTAIANTTDAAIRQILGTCARWAGLDPETVEVAVNREFAKETLTGADLVSYMTAWTQGAPITHEDIHAIAARAGIARETYEDTQAANEQDRGTAFGTGSGNFQMGDGTTDEDQGKPTASASPSSGGGEA